MKPAAEVLGLLRDTEVLGQWRGSRVVHHVGDGDLRQGEQFSEYVADVDHALRRDGAGGDLGLGGRALDLQENRAPVDGTATEEDDHAGVRGPGLPGCVGDDEEAPVQDPRDASQRAHQG